MLVNLTVFKSRTKTFLQYSISPNKHFTVFILWSYENSKIVIKKYTPVYSELMFSDIIEVTMQNVINKKLLWSTQHPM